MTLVLNRCADPQKMLIFKRFSLSFQSFFSILIAGHIAVKVNRQPLQAKAKLFSFSQSHCCMRFPLHHTAPINKTCVYQEFWSVNAIILGIWGDEVSLHSSRPFIFFCTSCLTSVFKFYERHQIQRSTFYILYMLSTLYGINYVHRTHLGRIICRT